MFLYQILSLLLLVSCQPNQKDPIEAMRAKSPLVSFLPIRNELQDETLPWNLSDELSEEILQNLHKGHFLGEHEMQGRQIPLAAYSSADVRFASQFHPSQYVVLVEWLDHRWIPARESHLKKMSEWRPTALSMRVRLKIIDIRDEKPKLCLQEIVEHELYMDPFAEMPAPIKKRWREPGYEATPLGRAHLKLAETISAKVAAAVARD
ncbi:MAG: hypothetical protein K0S07_542 [Chlamydiales bacterium]|jgi:hypothetical protein|nr:hypothetical protein [Chlamydiales bacterium]